MKSMVLSYTILAVAGIILEVHGAGSPAFNYDSSKSSIYLEQTLAGSASGSATELRRELSAVVDEILDGPWLPLYTDYSATEAGGVGPAEWCFNRPGEYLLALSQAAPCLTPEQKAKARELLKGMIQASPPTRQIFLMQKEGKARNVRKTPAPRWPSLNGPDTQRNLFTEAYAVWAYAQAFGAWNEATPLFEDLKKLREPLELRGDFSPAYQPDHDLPPPLKSEISNLKFSPAYQPDHDLPLTSADLKDAEYCFRVYESLLAGFQDNYGYHGARKARQRMQKNQPVFFYVKNLAGLIGYYRLARHLGQEDEARWAEQTFNKVAALALHQKSAPYLWSDPCLAPEIARLIRDAAGKWLDKLARTPNVGNLPATDWNGKVAPGRRDHAVMNPYTWYHAGGGQGEGVRPRSVLGAFLVNAYLFRAPADQIVQTLDIPWCKADLYYASKLVTAIQAVEKPGWIRVN